MKVEVAKSAGFCFGVDRAVKLAEETAKSGPAATLGPIVHNAEVVAELERDGARMIGGFDELREGETLIICSHGAPRSVYERIEREHIPAVDATCPYVRRIHSIAAEASAEGRILVVIGDPEHTEVKGITSRADRYAVFSDETELEKWLLNLAENDKNCITFVAQTTLNADFYKKCLKISKKLCTNPEIFDTICKATNSRQPEAVELAGRCDCMIVVGDRRSANTRRLYELCLEKCPETYWVERADELQLRGGYKSVGITAGASTPKWIIEEVNRKMDEMKNNVTEPEKEVMETAEERVSEPAETGEPGFEEMLEQSFKTLTSGEKMTGTVMSITPTEIQVDLGTKHAGYIPLSELSDDPNAKPEELVKVGDEIEVFVVRVNDGEGTAMLSKKRLDSIKGWEDVENACESGDTMEGIVTEENKGGIVSMVKGVRVFVPASQTGVPRGGELAQLIGQRIKLKITEVNRARRRVVGSIRRVEAALRRERAEAIWNDIEVGKEYDGTVKSLTSYGAFVDIGGVDGMVHVSEISWKRIRQPSDVLKVGDQVHVHVIGLDREKHKISLGIRRPEDNPWTKFMTGYKIGDVAQVKVVKLMTFGAFAEIVPGVDGLIHISQIANRRIDKPEDVLSEGQVVEAKITNVDEENHKVWLSIRALSEPEKTEEPAAKPEPEEEDGGYVTDTVVASSEDGKLEISEEIAHEVEGEGEQE